MNSNPKQDTREIAAEGRQPGPQKTAAPKDRCRFLIEIIKGLTKVPEIGEEFEGVAKRIEPYGAFVEILPGQDGLLHISETSMTRIPDIRDVLNEGDTIKVRIIDIDGNDRIKLSHRVILEDEARARGEDVPERDPLRGGRSGGGRDNRGGRGRPPRRDDRRRR